MTSQVSAAWAQGELFVTNFGGASVTVYARTAGGDVAPLRTLTGPNFPRGVAVDPVHNEIVAANIGDSSVTVFARTASGTIVASEPGAAPPGGLVSHAAGGSRGARWSGPGDGQAWIGGSNATPSPPGGVAAGLLAGLEQAHPPISATVARRAHRTGGPGSKNLGRRAPRDPALFKSCGLGSRRGQKEMLSVGPASKMV